jgi:6-phosphofructokinase
MLSAISPEMANGIASSRLVGLGAILKHRSQGSPFGVAVLVEGLIEAIGERGLLDAFGSEDNLRRYGKVGRDAHGRLRLGEIEFGRMIREHLARRLEAHSIKLPLSLVDKDLGYELRCADPIPLDAEYTRDLGHWAVKLLPREAAGYFGAIISFIGGRMRPLRQDPAGAERLRGAGTPSGTGGGGEEPRAVSTGIRLSGLDIGH